MKRRFQIYVGREPETLFDIGAETPNLVVRGGAIALRVAKAIAEKNKA